MNIQIFLLGIVIFFARICDVSLGTIRTITIVQGRSRLAFILGFVEVIIWILIVSTVVSQIKEYPLLILFYAGGFATGNAVGIWIEKKLSIGVIILRVISRKNTEALVKELRSQGQTVTTFIGEGLSGRVVELYIVCRRRDLRWILRVVQQFDPEAFYVTEQARDVSKIVRPGFAQPTGWRAIFKKK